MSERYYHGTTALSAVCIEVEGFRLLDERVRHWGRGYLGHGIYLSRSLPTARWFRLEGPYVLEVALGPGTKVLRVEGSYDPRRIRSLRREFGRGILSPDFEKAIPRNKELRPRELIDLVNWLYQSDRRRDRHGFYEGLRAIRRSVRRTGYSAFGDREGDVGMVL